MNILYSPQVSENEMEYSFEGEKVTIRINDITETFDFSVFEEGDILKNIESDLPVNPFIEIKRKEGILSLVLLRFIEEDASEEDKFPDWIEV